MDASSRRYALESGAALAGYAGLLVLSLALLRTGHLGLWRYPVALLPVLFVPAAVIAFVRLLRRLDELQRRIEFDALAYGFGATVLVTFTYGFLENAGLPRLSWVWVTALAAPLWGAARVVARQRYS